MFKPKALHAQAIPISKAPGAGGELHQIAGDGHPQMTTNKGGVQWHQTTRSRKAAEDGFGRIDVLVNNTRIDYFAAVEESETVQICEMFDVNSAVFRRKFAARIVTAHEAAFSKAEQRKEV